MCCFSFPVGWVLLKLGLVPSGGCLRERGTGGDRDPRRWGKRETVSNVILCHHQNDSALRGTKMRAVLMFL